MDGGAATTRTRHDDDFLLWAREQAAAIRARDWAEVDWELVAEEMESLGISERNVLENRLIRLMAHLLKLEYGHDRAPERQWRLTVEEQRRRLRRLLKSLPSLRARLPEVMADTYTDAREEALDGFRQFEQERLSEYEAILPKECPFSPEEVL